MNFYEREYRFLNKVLQERDTFNLIAEGKIERGRKQKWTDYEAGFRPLTIKDAREIAKYAKERLNNAINEFQNASPNPIIFDKLTEACYMALEHLKGIGAQTKENVIEHIEQAILRVNKPGN